MTKLFQIEERNPKDIIILNRSRTDKGDLKDLIEAIQLQGQLNPVLITPENILIAGERRTLACKKLNIPVLCRIMPGLSSEDKLFIEHMENEARKNFTWSEELMLRFAMHSYWVDQTKNANPPVSWTFKDTAKKFNCSIGGLSTDLTLAAGIKVFPDLMNCKSKGQAQETYKKMAEQATAFKKMSSMSDTEKDKMKKLMSGSAINTQPKKKEKQVIHAKHDDDITNLLDYGSTKKDSLPYCSEVERTEEEEITEESSPYTLPECSLENEVSYVVESLFTFVPKFPDESIGFIELDPPYAIDFETNYQQQNKEVQTKKDWTADDMVNFCTIMFPVYYSKLMPNSWMLCWTGKEWWSIINEYAARVGFKTQPFGVWVKQGGSVNRPSTTMVSMFECFVLLRKGNATFNTPSFPSVISCPTTSGSAKTHQWEKPIKLYDMFFEAMGREAVVFHSSFAGSGNCLISAKKAGMIPIGCDLSESDATQFYYKYKKHFMEI